MALEDTLTQLIASIDANTAALKGSKGGGGGVAVVEAPARGPGRPLKAKADTVEFDELKVAANRVAEKLGKAFAKKLITTTGGAKELAVVKAEKYPALLKAFNEALAETAAEEDDGDEDEL